MWEDEMTFKSVTATSDWRSLAVKTPRRRFHFHAFPSMSQSKASLGWLISTAQPGDHLLLAFSGYGCQHPRSAGSEKCESYLVPSDFADELPKGFFKAMEAVAGEAAKLDNTALGGACCPAQ
eukprot:symbB.v1.2.040409.t1/scaffold7209.1/size12641/2